MSEELQEFSVAGLSANELRALAEAADSLRNTEGCIVKNPDSDEPRYLAVSRAAADAKSLTPVALLRTNDVPTISAARERVRFDSDRALAFTEGRALDINDCDAIFTSLAAVEKFVVPYYARLRGLEECERMRAKFAMDSQAVALVHLPGSVEDTARLSASANLLVAGRPSVSTMKLLPADTPPTTLHLQTVRQFLDG